MQSVLCNVAVQDEYLADVRTVLIDPNDKDGYTLINQYIGQIVSAKWDSSDRVASENLASVLMLNWTGRTTQDLVRDSLLVICL